MEKLLILFQPTLKIRMCYSKVIGGNMAKIKQFCSECKSELSLDEYFLSEHNICKKCTKAIWKKQGMI